MHVSDFHRVPLTGMVSMLNEVFINKSSQHQQHIHTLTFLPSMVVSADSTPIVKVTSDDLRVLTVLILTLLSPKSVICVVPPVVIAAAFRSKRATPV